MYKNVTTNADLQHIVYSLPIIVLSFSEVNNVILTIMTCFNG